MCIKDDLIEIAQDSFDSLGYVGNGEDGFCHEDVMVEDLEEAVFNFADAFLKGGNQQEAITTLLDLYDKRVNARIEEYVEEQMYCKKAVRKGAL